MITIRNQQRAVAIDCRWIEDVIACMLSVLKYHDFDVGILLTTNATIRRYNKEYRQKDKPTDILSFPYHPDLQPGKRIKVLVPEDKNLGDIIISLAYAKKDASNWGHSFDEHMVMLLAHGIAHLLCYDHITDEQHAVMSRVEKKLKKATFL